jgi:hypothetical protein
LNKTVEDAGEMPRTFQRINGDAFRLEIAMKVQALIQIRVVTYSFELEPISVERIDVLEARMRDLQGEVKALRVEAGERTEVVELQDTVKQLQAELSCRQAEIADLQNKVENPLLTIQAEADSNTSEDVVCWSATGNYTDGNDGIIRNLQPGAYQVTVVVNYVGTGEKQLVELLKGGEEGECLQVVCCCGFTAGCTSSVLAQTASIDEGDELSVVCNPDLTSEYPCYLMLTRVGNSSW